MKQTLRSNALLLCLAFGWVATAQAAEPGWYAIGFGGESSADVSQSRMDENLVALFARGGFEVVDATSTLDDADTAFGLGGGFQMNRYFSVEFAYVDLGSIDYRADATVSDGVEQAADVQLGTSAQGPVVTALGILPIGERFSVFGRAGLSLLEAEGKARITLGGEIGRASQSSQKADPILGIGAEFDLTRHWTIRLAWDRYFDVGTEDVTGDADADVITLGLRLSSSWFR